MFSGMFVSGKHWALPSCSKRIGNHETTAFVPGEHLISHLCVLLALTLSLCVFDSIFWVCLSAGQVFGRHWRHRGFRVWWRGGGAGRALGGLLDPQGAFPPMTHCRDVFVFPSSSRRPLLVFADLRGGTA